MFDVNFCSILWVVQQKRHVLTSHEDAITVQIEACPNTLQGHVCALWSPTA